MTAIDHAVLVLLWVVIVFAATFAGVVMVLLISGLITRVQLDRQEVRSNKEQLAKWERR